MRCDRSGGGRKRVAATEQTRSVSAAAEDEYVAAASDGLTLYN